MISAMHDFQNHWGYVTGIKAILEPLDLFQNGEIYLESS